MSPVAGSNNVSEMVLTGPTPTSSTAPLMLECTFPMEVYVFPLSQIAVPGGLFLLAEANCATARRATAESSRHTRNRLISKPPLAIALFGQSLRLVGGCQRPSTRRGAMS